MKSGLHPLSPARTPRSDTPAAVTLISVHGDPTAPIGTDGAGGQNVYVRELGRALRALGHPVRVYTRQRNSSGALDVVDLDGVTVVRLPCGPAGYIPRTQLFPYLPEFIVQASSWAREHPCDPGVIHSNYWLSGWVGMALARHWQTPHVHTPHSLGAVKDEAMAAEGADSAVRLNVEEEIATQADALIATSPADLIARNRHYSVVGQPEVIPCGYNPAIFHPGDREAARARWGIPRENPVIAYVGRFDPGKGLNTLMEAFEQLQSHPKLQLILAGGFVPGGTDEAEYTRWRSWVSAQPWHNRVHWLGRMDSEDVADVYRAASIVVVPSRYESFGMVALEAMACGTPVVASDVGGLRQTVIHRETGLLFPVGDSEALRHACEHLLSDNALWERVSTFAARNALRCYPWARVAAQMSELYARCLAQRA